MISYFYHVTTWNGWGEKVRLIPQPFLPGRAPTESLDPRICVGPSPWHCLIAVQWREESYKGYYVYRTLRKHNSYKPRRVPDAHVTLERWLMHPAWFVHVGYIPPVAMGTIHWPCSIGVHEDTDTQRRILPSVERMVREQMEPGIYPAYLEVIK